MRLAVDLAIRVVLVTGLCLSAATAWVMWEAVAGTRAEMQASAERVAREARFDTWHVLLTVGPGQAAPSGAVPERWSRLVGPGICVGVAPASGTPNSDTRTLCGSWGGVGSAAPAWFEAAYAHHQLFIGFHATQQLEGHGNFGGSITLGSCPLAWCSSQRATTIAGWAGSVRLPGWAGRRGDHR